jgi:hypothetical protein
VIISHVKPYLSSITAPDSHEIRGKHELFSTPIKKGLCLTAKPLDFYGARYWD